MDRSNGSTARISPSTRTGRGLFDKLWAIPGVRRRQTGDTEMRAVFPRDVLEQVAFVIRARRRRTQAAPNSLRNLRPRSSSGAGKAISGDRPSHDLETVDVALRSDRESNV
jgi:hypothetical protein